jgi:hypothetical protein
MLQRKPRRYDLIAMNLLIAWSDVVAEPLPGRIHRLLERLANEESAQQRRHGGERRTNAPKRAHH